MKIQTANNIKSIKDQGLKSIYPEKLKIAVGMATCGLATGAKKIYDQVSKLIEEKKLDIILKKTGCLGYCQKEPLMDVYIPGLPRLTYSEMTEERVNNLIASLGRDEINIEGLMCKFEEEELISSGRSKRYSLFNVPDNLKNIPLYQELPFFSKQKKIALRNCGYIDPDSIKEYIGRGGYGSIFKILNKFSPEEVIKEIKISGLRGRGGAGFPTGLKWEFCRKSSDSPKYIICNADEGDPGAYMDRSVLEGDPHSIIEGMLIGAYAIGASRGYIYVRTEYSLAIKRLESAIEQAKKFGLLGKNIFGTDFNFDIEIMQGAGAFVCGEETSLIASIEGKNPEPIQRPPFPAESGLRGKPTNINNVETWSNIPVIMARGGKWFSNIGTKKSKGTKVFSLVGKINNTGLVEVPMGISLSEIVYDIGNGIPDQKKLKAVQTGGPSGGFIPKNLIELPVDYESLSGAGSIMGSGGMIVIDEDTCLIDLAKFFLEFTNEESCGKCTSCREGSEALLEILSKISYGNGEEEDIEFLKDLCLAIKDASLCGLGQTLPNPILSTLRYFREEYEDHIKYKKCPAVVCKGIISSPCQHSCPMSQDVPSYIGLITQGNFSEAIKVIREKNPLPGICGRVCHHPCEDKCTSKDTDEAIAICSLKRFTADFEMENVSTIKKPENIYEEKVAVVGSGPSGLSCAYFLRKFGYKVTVFEKLPVLGGMMAVGIPEYRLPKHILNYDIEVLKQMDIEFKTDVSIGDGVKFADLNEKGYKAIFIGVGAHKGLRMNIDNEDVDGVIDSLEFLRNINLSKNVKIGKNVAVVGGGDAAIDSARAARRLGNNVEIFYRRTRAEMPAQESEIEAAIEEGIKIRYLSMPTKILSKNGTINAIECTRMELGDVDESGRQKPVPVKGSQYNISIDTLIIAIGCKPDISFLNDNNDLEFTKSNTIKVDGQTLSTKKEGVFAGGDVVTGPKTVSEAISQGKTAAESINKFLRGEKLIREYKVTETIVQVEPIKLSEEEIEKLKRQKMPSLSVAQRITNFKEVELGFNRKMAINEAKRCLRCDLREK